MARRRTRVPLSVYLNGRLVGRLRRLASGAVDFLYDQSWLDWPHAMPVSTSLPLREDLYIGEPVIAVIDNLLPDNEPIRRQVAERVRAEGHDAYSLLAKVGRDCVGALQFLPQGIDPGAAGQVRAVPLTDGEIAAKLRGLARAPLGIDENEEFRISIAGAQEKTALLYQQGSWHLPQGTTATTHILKPQMGPLPNGIDMRQSVENEYFCLKLCAALGLPTAKAEIRDFEDQRVLVVERFDRVWTDDQRLLRRPQEDCCQALSVPSTLKYDADGGPGMADILQLLKGSDDPDTDMRLFLKAQILFWLMGATDGHGKNFSITLKPGGRFRATPIYDVMSSQPAMDDHQIRKNQYKLAMAVGDKRHYVMHTIASRHFEQTAKRVGMPPRIVSDICAELHADCAGAIDATLAKLPSDFPHALASSIVDGMQARLLI